MILKSLLHLILFPGTLTVLVPHLILESGSTLGRFEPGPALMPAGILLGVFGVVLLLWCTRQFVAEGKGTPNPLAPTRHLVRGSAYGVVRNPMYVAVVSIVLGEALFFGSGALAIYAAILLAGFHLFVVLYEEPTLRRRHGPDYAVYCEEVSRWLPRMRRHGPGSGRRGAGSTTAGRR